ASYGFHQHSNHDNAIESILTNNEPKITVPDSVDSGFSKDVNIVLGVNTADNRGNATVYASFRTNSSILQGPYDYSACTLNSGDDFSCGGCSTTGPPTSLGRFQQRFPGGNPSRGPNQSLAAGGTLVPFTNANLYNFGAVNFYMRPDERWAAGAFAHYEFNDHA